MFQSYLYGIEIRTRRINRFCHNCFNRTFMELKSNKFNFTRIYASFQSYLYGIEIISEVTSTSDTLVSIVPLWNWNLLYHALTSITQKVSIVPLWNWNEADYQSTKIDRMFQSYLYGIEINYSWVLTGEASCFNRTFMELKFVLAFCRFVWTLMFQSYLYGIEIKRT